MRMNIEDGRLDSVRLGTGISRLTIIQVLGATFTITTAMPQLLFLDPDGANRIVLLPAEASSKGLEFTIANTGNNDEYLLVKEDSGTTIIGVIANNESMSFNCDGTTWFGPVAAAGQEGVAAGGTLTLVAAQHGGRTIYWDTAAGSVVTLPTAAGTGVKFRLVVSVTATSNSHVLKCAAAADIMYGSITSIDVDTSDATLAWAAEAADAMDTITFNRTTTGLAAIGDWVEVQDIGTNKWAVTGVIRANGTVATPFTSAV